MDYAAVVAKILEQVIERGATEEEVREAFGPASDEDLRCLTDLYGTFAYPNPAYSEEEMADLKELHVPSSVVEFYRRYDPKWLPMLDGYVCLCGLPAIRDENTSGAPGPYLIRFGVMVFAVTVGGNAICMDLNRLTDGEPRVLAVDLTFCSYDERSKTVECGFAPDDVYAEYKRLGKPFTLSYELIDRCNTEIAPTFSEFLWRLANREYEDLEKFMRY